MHKPRIDVNIPLKECVTMSYTMVNMSCNQTTVKEIAQPRYNFSFNGLTANSSMTMVIPMPMTPAIIITQILMDSNPRPVADNAR